MAAPSSLSIVPTIDFEEVSLSELRQLREACEEWGCFRLVNHNVPLSLMREMKKVVRELLDLPTEVKMRNVDSIAGSGYMAPSKINPLYEALGLYDMASPLALHAFSSQLHASPHQREVISQYGKAISGLATELARKMAESLNLKPEADWFEDWTCQFRINKYSFTPETVGSSGVQEHTDSSFLTILQDDENIGGLEVQPNNAGTYVPVDPISGTLLVNLGDIATVWSNGRFCNVIHRVQCKEAGIRISIASFLLGPSAAQIESPEELVDPQHPRLFVPFTYVEYRKKRVSSKLVLGALPLFRAADSKLPLEVAGEGGALPLFRAADSKLPFEYPSI